jgi:hypothetical protein
VGRCRHDDQAHQEGALCGLASTLVIAAVEGRLPHGIGVARLFDALVGWSRQHHMLRLAN